MMVPIIVARTCAPKMAGPQLPRALPLTSKRPGLAEPRTCRAAGPRSLDSWPRNRRAVDECGPNRALELGDRERLVQEWLPWGQSNAIILDHLRAVRRHEKDLNVGADDTEFLCQLPPAHEWHHDVREEQMEGFGTAACEPQGLARVPRAQHRVPRHPQDVRGH